MTLLCDARRHCCCWINRVTCLISTINNTWVCAVHHNTGIQIFCFRAFDSICIIDSIIVMSNALRLTEGTTATWKGCFLILKRLKVYVKYFKTFPKQSDGSMLSLWNYHCTWVVRKLWQNSLSTQIQLKLYFSLQLSLPSSSTKVFYIFSKST